ncbi:hypothetical protein [Flavobacterium sp.]|uniref:hypothetical protein n=1 Tax=Flavobacterium sp. TaxID=239 RepID=UPI004034B387
MKKFTLLLAFVAAGFAFTSCSDDDSNSTQFSASLIGGKWQHEKTGFRVMEQETLEDYTHSEGCSKDYVEFLEDGVYKWVVYNGDNNCDEVVRTETYMKNGETLTVGEGEEFESFKIEELTETQLRTKTIYMEQEGSATVYQIDTYIRVGSAQ